MTRPARHHLLFALALATACSNGRDEPAPARGATAVVDAGPPAPTAAAQLTSITGTVTVTRAGTLSAAATGPLFVGDVIETATGSNAVLRFTDGRELELGEEGRIEIGLEGDGLLLNVGQGVVLSRVASGAGASVQLSLATPYGLVRVGAGGVTLDVGPEEATIDVLTGEVTLVGREGGPLSLEAGAAGTLSKKGANRKLTLEPLAIVIFRSSGRVELKKKAARSFAAVNAKKPPTLNAGDSLRVTQGSVTLSPTGSDAKVTLVSGSEVGIGESQKWSGAEALALELKKGQLQLTLPFGQKRALKAGDGVTFEADQGGQLTVVKSQHGLELNSIVGDVVVATEGGQRVTVKGGQSATVTKAGVEARDVARQALQLPSRQGLRLLHPGAERLALVWPGDDDKPYRLILAADATLETPLVDGIVRQPWFNTQAPARGALHWKVMEGETEIARGSVAISAERLGDELDGITNEVPAGPEKTVIFFQDKPPALTFTWKTPDKPVAEYLFKLYRAGKLDTPLQERRVSTTSAQLPHGAVPEGAYQWDVTWLDAAGTPMGTAGKMNQLVLNYDNAVRALIIKAPRNGDPASAKVAVSGVAPIGVKVAVNGQPLPLDTKARFSAQVAPLAGARVAFRVVVNGVETYVVRWLGKGGAR